MSALVQWVKEYVGLFLACTLVLYVIPSNEYRGYLRFFLEIILVLFCLHPMIAISHMDIQDDWERTYRSFYEELELREQEAKEMVYLDWGYINKLAEHSEEQEE